MNKLNVKNIRIVEIVWKIFQFEIPQKLSRREKYSIDCTKVNVQLKLSDLPILFDQLFAKQCTILMNYCNGHINFVNHVPATLSRFHNTNKFVNNIDTVVIFSRKPEFNLPPNNSSFKTKFNFHQDYILLFL